VEEHVSERERIRERWNNGKLREGKEVMIHRFVFIRKNLPEISDVIRGILVAIMLK
jgi:hypothetical protein